jgi:hypothetical protein
MLVSINMDTGETTFGAGYNDPSEAARVFWEAVASVVRRANPRNMRHGANARNQAQIAVLTRASIATRSGHCPWSARRSWKVGFCLGDYARGRRHDTDCDEVSQHQADAAEDNVADA